MANTSQRIEFAVREDPSLISVLQKDSSINKGYLYNRLRRLIPHRFGIEFECFGTLLDHLNKKYHRKDDNLKFYNIWFNVYDLDEDADTFNLGNPNYANEIRISCIDFRQLKGLYRLLQEMGECCSISPDCGIHIHVDLTKFDTTFNWKLFAEYSTNHLNEIEAIFPKYTGSYNKRKVGVRSKGTYLNFSRHGTAEFRIAPLTFDYKQLVDWIIDCEKFISKMIVNCSSHINRNNIGLSSNSDDMTVRVVSNDPITIPDPDAYDLDNLRFSRISSYSAYTYINGTATSYYDTYGMEV